jgi:hypothetical protein
MQIILMTRYRHLNEKEIKASFYYGTYRGPMVGLEYTKHMAGQLNNILLPILRYPFKYGKYTKPIE